MALFLLVSIRTRLVFRVRGQNQQSSFRGNFLDCLNRPLGPILLRETLSSLVSQQTQPAVIYGLFFGYYFGILKSI